MEEVRIKQDPQSPEPVELAREELRETPTMEELRIEQDPQSPVPVELTLEKLRETPEKKVEVILPKPEFRIEQDPLSPESVELAREELRETPERKAEAILKLRELLHENKDLFYRDDDDFLVIFLRPCKFYPESAIALMRRIAEFKKANAEVLDNLMPVDEKAAFLDNDVVNILKARDHKGRRVLIVNVGGSWDPKKVNADQLFRLFYLIHEAAMLEPETQVRGVVVIMDFEKMSMTQVTGLGYTFSKRLMAFIQDAMPLRLKEVHFVKEPWVFSIVWNIFKPLIKPKLKSRMFFHKNNMKSLHKHLAPSHLPANYGGELPAIDYTGAQWFEVVQGHLDHIEAWNSYGFVKKE